MLIPADGRFRDPLLPLGSTRSGQSGTRRFFYSLVMPIDLLNPPRR